MQRKKTQRTGSGGSDKRAQRSGKKDAIAQEFARTLSDEDIMLLRLRDELYEGRWDIMLADLNDRLQGRPYIFKLANRIQDDIERIHRLSRFEREHNVDLAKLI